MCETLVRQLQQGHIQQREATVKQLERDVLELERHHTADLENSSIWRVLGEAEKALSSG